jgi:hypothetical protein
MMLLANGGSSISSNLLIQKMLQPLLNVLLLKLVNCTYHFHAVLTIIATNMLIHFFMWESLCLTANLHFNQHNNDVALAEYFSTLPVVDADVVVSVIVGVDDVDGVAVVLPKNLQNNYNNNAMFYHWN